MRSKGVFGEAPEWYLLIRAAKYLGVPPWELADRPQWWMNIALEAENAEASAQKAETESATKKKAGAHAHGG